MAENAPEAAWVGTPEYHQHMNKVLLNERQEKFIRGLRANGIAIDEVAHFEDDANRAPDGFPGYNLEGTKTGRLSSLKPNLSNTPKGLINMEDPDYDAHTVQAEVQAEEPRKLQIREPEPPRLNRQQLRAFAKRTIRAMPKPKKPAPAREARRSPR